MRRSLRMHKLKQNWDFTAQCLTMETVSFIQTEVYLFHQTQETETSCSAACRVRADLTGLDVGVCVLVITGENCVF